MGRSADTTAPPSGTPSATEVTALVSKLGLSVYPAKGQSKQQQVRDERLCYAWAHNQTGIDPMAAAANRERQAAGQAAQPAQAKVAQMTGTFTKAMSACLAGKGYTAK